MSTNTSTKMKWTHWILYVFCFPWDALVAWPIVLIIRALWGKDLRWETPPPYDHDRGGGGGPCLTCQIREGTLPVRQGTFPVGWYMRKKTGQAWGGTTLGHAIFYGPRGRAHDPATWGGSQPHEHVHVEQFEVSMVQGFVVGLASGIVLWSLGHPIAGTVAFLMLWFVGYLMMGLAGWPTAWLRGEEAYWGSTHEESARGQTRRS